jgi:hypothetical protein
MCAAGLKVRRAPRGGPRPIRRDDFGLYARPFRCFSIICHGGSTFSGLPTRQECKRCRGDDNLAPAAQLGRWVCSPRQRAGVVIVKEFSQLLAQTFVALALVPKNDGAFEQGVLQLLGQLAPEIGRGRAEDQKESVGGLVSATAAWVRCVVHE